MAAKVATKSEILANIAEQTELSRKQVAAVFVSLSEQIKANVGKKGPGTFVVPGLMKIIVVQKPAVPRTRESTRSPSRSRCSRPSRPARSSRSGRSRP